APARRAPLWSRDFVLALLCQTATFAAYGLTLASAPVMAASVGGSTTDIGLVTTSFSLLTVILEMQTAVLLRRFTVRELLRVALLLLAAGTAMLFFVGSSIPLMWLAAAIRGTGFGCCVVAGLALSSELAPAP